jgi:glycosyltransferase involved in cell wall biosynthesis
MPFKLSIFGEGQMKEELKELVKKYELGDHVTFKGLIPYGETFYNALREYDAILVPNLSGEQPRIIFDAMANGLVVIGSTNPFKGIIKSGINGILCDPRNPESFALAVQRLYEDRGFQERLIYARIKTVEENTINSIHERRMKILINRLKLNSA